MHLSFFFGAIGWRLRESFEIYAFRCQMARFMSDSVFGLELGHVSACIKFQSVQNLMFL